MIARVVPVQRIRRATTAWSYRLPPRSNIEAGALVVVPFRGRPCLAIVWETLEHDDQATESVSEVIIAHPFVRQPQRHLAEWLADTGFISLSTALYVMLPAALRRFPLTKPAHALLHEHAAFKPTAATLDSVRQQLAVIPSERAAASRELSQRLGQRFLNALADQGDTAELETWLKVARGEITVVAGRDRAIFAPFLNLRHIRVTDPEDFAYFREQLPLVSLVEATKALAEAHRAELTYRSQLPDGAAKALWGEYAVGNPIQAPVTVRRSAGRSPVTPELLEFVRQFPRPQEIIALYNAKDRLVAAPDGLGKLLLAGVETVRKELHEQAPELKIQVGTRQMFEDLPARFAASVVLSLDPLLAAESFADRIHGLADLGRLLSRPAPCFVQTRDESHPLVHALRNGHFAEYCLSIVEERRATAAPPFSRLVACSLPIDTAEALDNLRARLAAELDPTPWRVSFPFESKRWKKRYRTVALIAPINTRLPTKVTKLLSSLERPWRVEHGPWHLL